MAKNVIMMIGDGMGWEMTRAGAIQNQIEAEIAAIREENPDITNEELATQFEGRTLEDYQGSCRGICKIVPHLIQTIDIQGFQNQVLSQTIYV